MNMSARCKISSWLTVFARGAVTSRKETELDRQQDFSQGKFLGCRQ
jgi:hypothetical protein